MITDAYRDAHQKSAEFRAFSFASPPKTKYNGDMSLMLKTTRQTGSEGSYIA